MPSPIIGGIVAAFSVVFFALGYVNLGACKGGYSGIYFGIALLMLAGSAATFRQMVVALVMLAISLILIVAGILLTNAAAGAGFACPI